MLSVGYIDELKTSEGMKSKPLKASFFFTWVFFYSGCKYLQLIINDLYGTRMNYHRLCIVIYSGLSISQYIYFLVADLTKWWKIKHKLLKNNLKQIKIWCEKFGY